MPGVPPNALSGLKKALKGIFKSSKKSKTTQAAQPTQQTNNAAPTSQAAKAQQPPAAAAAQSETGKTLPPTHPLATGQHDKPQEAIPQNHQAQPGPAPDSNVAVGPKGAANLTKEDYEKPQVSPTEPTSIAGRSEPVSAMDDASEDRPEVPAKDDGLAEDARFADTIASGNEPEEIISSPSDNLPNGTAPTTAEAPSAKAPTQHTTTTAQRLDPATSPITDGTSEQPLTNGVSEEATTEAKKEHTPVPAQHPHAMISDEKMPVMAEPPPIAAVRAAPGMSATSGPLEDFPEGGHEMNP